MNGWIFVIIAFIIGYYLGLNYNKRLKKNEGLIK